MITVEAPRVRSPQRAPAQTDKTPSAQSKHYVAPILGWVTNTPPSQQPEGSAIVLDNFWPTETGIEPRGGTNRRVTVANAVQCLFDYRAGASDVYFVADTTAVYAFTESTPDDTALTAAITRQTSGIYSFLEKQTDAGAYLTIVNGTDFAQIFDGTSWQQVTDVSSPFAITGVATNILSHVWSYRERTFFIEKGSMNAWYLGVNSVAGAATKLPLSGVFNKGGSLLLGATWSTDSGEGMDDRCVFMTDRGEVAVYTGGNPGDANDWSLDGVYDVGEPLGKNCTINVGGDLIIATNLGMVPLSAAMQKDPTQLRLDAISRAIDPDWRRAVVTAGSGLEWRLVKWEGRNMAVVAPPIGASEIGYIWTVNLETGAWSRTTGWSVGDIQVLGAGLYYGDASGNVFQCDVGGYDNGSSFECRACLAFDHLGAVGALKVAHVLRSTWKCNAAFNAKHTVASDYKPEFGTAPAVPSESGGNIGEWDASQWDVDFWAGDGATSFQIEQEWESVSGQGEVLAAQVQVTSGQTTKLACELISLNLLYSPGAVLHGV